MSDDIQINERFTITTTPQAFKITDHKEETKHWFRTLLQCLKFIRNQEAKGYEELNEAIYAIEDCMERDKELMEEILDERYMNFAYSEEDEG